MIDMKVFGDSRGKLISLEGNGDVIPFDIKRVYYIFDTAPGARSEHRGQRGRPRRDPRPRSDRTCAWWRR